MSTLWFVHCLLNFKINFKNWMQAQRREFLLAKHRNFTETVSGVFFCLSGNFFSSEFSNFVFCPLSFWNRTIVTFSPCYLLAVFSLWGVVFVCLSWEVYTVWPSWTLFSGGMPLKGTIFFRLSWLCLRHSCSSQRVLQHWVHARI